MLTGVSSIAIWKALSAISPAAVGSMPAITWVMSCDTKKWFIGLGAAPGSDRRWRS